MLSFAAKTSSGLYIWRGSEIIDPYNGAEVIDMPESPASAGKIFGHVIQQHEESFSMADNIAQIVADEWLGAPIELCNLAIGMLRRDNSPFFITDGAAHTSGCDIRIRTTGVVTTAHIGADDSGVCKMQAYYRERPHSWKTTILVRYGKDDTTIAVAAKHQDDVPAPNWADHAISIAGDFVAFLPEEQYVIVDFPKSGAVARTYDHVISRFGNEMYMFSKDNGYGIMMKKASGYYQHSELQEGMYDYDKSLSGTMSRPIGKPKRPVPHDVTMTLESMLAGDIIEILATADLPWLRANVIKTFNSSEPFRR
jgi:hypothetical protein